MKLEIALNSISSQLGRKAVARNTLFGAISSLRSKVSQLEGITKSVSILREKGYHHRAEAIANSARFKALDAQVEVAAQHAQGIYALASASFDLTPEFEPGVPKHLSQEQLAQISEFSGMSLSQVIDLRTKADNKRYATELEASSMTEAMFWAAEAEEDPEVKAESVLRALKQTMQFITTWSNPDFAELGILRVDIEIMETLAAREMEKEEAEGNLGINEEGAGRAQQYQPQEEGEEA